ncbi:hypothetical protein E2C01_095146 [Portunus trituberculatus]|uniref:Uncharacterized protein n=1 Tax=Portunus trituberculatus TaxID=210409 RepID=A0A5B7JZG2_PORTR|nr:hypothetical protein [Portunus trituberculatus]
MEEGLTGRRSMETKAPGQPRMQPLPISPPLKERKILGSPAMRTFSRDLQEGHRKVTRRILPSPRAT